MVERRGSVFWGDALRWLDHSGGSQGCIWAITDYAGGAPSHHSRGVSHDYGTN